jgi:hypothetical protein
MAIRYNPVARSTTAATPDYISAAISDQADQRAMKTAQRQDILGAGGLAADYNTEMNRQGRAPIADKLRDWGWMDELDDETADAVSDQMGNTKMSPNDMGMGPTTTAYGGQPFEELPVSGNVPHSANMPNTAAPIVDAQPMGGAAPTTAIPAASTSEALRNLDTTGVVDGVTGAVDGAAGAVEGVAGAADAAGGVADAAGGAMDAAGNVVGGLNIAADLAEGDTTAAAKSALGMYLNTLGPYGWAANAVMQIV